MVTIGKVGDNKPLVFALSVGYVLITLVTGYFYMASANLGRPGQSPSSMA